MTTVQSNIQSAIEETIDLAERQVRSGLRTAKETTSVAAVRVADRIRPLVPAQAAPIVERAPDPERLVGAAYGLANDILSANRRYLTDLGQAVSRLTGDTETGHRATGSAPSQARRSKPRSKTS
jgi:hypothetical protein